ncbi:TPA: hypothetical protein HA281_06190 [Candidatus Woesearchaeota archaeon]|nr:MAG: hypothetical protein QT04_C0060G0028 [archaeon GW2011_AR11]MBS3111524.1 hypothetical protein [Candidatus Woesearchaeota archaeon]HIH05541.1 hypothetical protein [Candidatus Woesearchaeota archaeon]HIH92361.1 hypothetical protein [Candidatus Woesearchaeota archaeon]HII65093.1 hypothetical protein [Candidatus Woesearchaeota archaeon]
MSLKNGAIIGATVAFLFYVFLSMATPLEGKSVFPTAHVIGDPEAMQQYTQGLPVSMIMFISLEVVGMILGVIGYRIIIGSTPKERPQKIYK